MAEHGKRKVGVQELPSYYIELTTCDGTSRVPGISIDGVRLLAKNLLQIHLNKEHGGKRCVLSKIGPVQSDTSVNTTIDPAATSSGG